MTMGGVDKINQSSVSKDESIQPKWSLTKFDISDTEKRPDGIQHTPVKVHHLCIVCDMTYEDICSLQSHISTSHCSIPCFVCDRILSTFDNLEKHLFMHTEENRKGYLCEICGHMIKGPAKFFRHLYLHHGKEGQFSCELCEKAFHSHKMLKRHEQFHRSFPKKCEVCSREVSRANFGSHMRTHEGDERRHDPHTCELCGRVFRRRDHLEYHINKHKGIKPFVCEQCGKSYSDQRHWYNHQLSHNKEKIYKCDICGFKTNTKATRNKHLKIHSELTKKFNCEFCNKVFRTPLQLREHTNIHTGARPYECKLCGKRFRWRSNIKEHLQNQHKTC